MQVKESLSTLALAVLISGPVWGHETTSTAEEQKLGQTTLSPKESSSAPKTEEQNLAQAAPSSEESSAAANTALANEWIRRPAGPGCEWRPDRSRRKNGDS